MSEAQPASKPIGPTLADPWKRTASVGDGAVYITAASNPGFPIVWTDTPERAEFVLGACASSVPLQAALVKAEGFIRGFEGDQHQDGIDQLLAEIRKALTDAGVQL